MFGRTKHVHTWGGHTMVRWINTLSGTKTEFKVVCTDCGKTGKYVVDGGVYEEHFQRQYAASARKNGWFK